ncbi:MAG: HAMP domain-containing protein [Deltaproteobacteria bacterium]|nr:MAG: HAMP domain-containing protein [Deltaproteobacteria bacterium]
MKIRTRVKIAGAVTVCVLLAYGAAVVHLDRTMSDLAGEVKEAHKFVNKISILRNLTQDYLLYHTERAQRQWAALYDEVLRMLESPEYQEFKTEHGLGDARQKLKIVGDTFARLMSVQQTGGAGHPEVQLRGELQSRLATQLLLATQDLLTRFFNLTDEINQKLVRTQRLITFLDILALLSLGLIIVSAGVFLQRAVVKPVLKLHEGAEIIGAGNLDHQVGIHTPDEVGGLTRAFDRMTANLREITVSRDELVREIEERKRAEGALRQSEEHYRSLFEHMLDGFAYCRMHFEENRPIDFTYLKVNDSFETLTGLKNVIGKKVSEVIPGIRESNPELFEIYGRVALTGKPERFEVYLNPLKMWLSISVYSPQKEYFVAVFDVITARKRAEEKIKHLASFPEMNPAPVLELDLSGVIFYHNQAALAALEKMGAAAQLTDFLPGDLGDIIATAREGKEKFFYREVKVKNTIFAQNIFFAEPFNLLRIYSMDITKRRLAEEMLRETMLDLERSNRDLEEFAFVSSHDLQEPLRKIANFSEMLGELYQGRLDEQADRYLGYITDGAKRMQTLINDLLEYSRVGRGDLAMIPVSMEEVLKGTLNDLQPLLQESQAQVSRDPLPVVEVNPHQMGQLLQNLITNAVKFRGDRLPRIHISARREGEMWVFAVRDEGIGFDSQHAERIFKVFHRLHSKEKYQGTGIGLSICKKIAERHGGRCWAESQPGRGATFYFSIPA